MRIQTFILADAVDVGPQQKVFIHGGELNVITAESIPYVVPRFAVFATMVQEDDDSPGSDHTFALRIFDPAGQQLGDDMAGEFRLGASDIAEVPSRVNLALRIQGLTLTSDGIYRIELVVDGEVIAGQAFVVTVVGPEQAD